MRVSTLLPAATSFGCSTLHGGVLSLCGALGVKVEVQVQAKVRGKGEDEGEGETVPST